MLKISGTIDYNHNKLDAGSNENTFINKGSQILLDFSGNVKKPKKNLIKWLITLVTKKTHNDSTQKKEPVKSETKKSFWTNLRQLIIRIVLVFCIKKICNALFQYFSTWITQT